MSARGKIEDEISRVSLQIPDLTSEQRKKGVAKILSEMQRQSLHTPHIPTQPDLDLRTEFGVAHTGIGTASIKFTNYFISWKRLIIAGGSLPAAYLSSTLTAMTILGFLVRGAVHVFDEIDAKILHIIHENSEILPMETSKFYEQLSESFSKKKVAKDLYLERVVRLSGYGAISIDDDMLKITEIIYSFDH